MELLEKRAFPSAFLEKAVERLARRGLDAATRRVIVNRLAAYRMLEEEVGLDPIHKAASRPDRLYTSMKLAGEATGLYLIFDVPLVQYSTWRLAHGVAMEVASWLSKRRPDEAADALLALHEGAIDTGLRRLISVAAKWALGRDTLVAGTGRGALVLEACRALGLADECAKRLTIVEEDLYAAHTTAVLLTALGARSPPRALLADLALLKPGQAVLIPYVSRTGLGEEHIFYIPPRFDSIIGNAARARQAASFIQHALEFLKEGGRAAFIAKTALHSKWLKTALQGPRPYLALFFEKGGIQHKGRQEPRGSQNCGVYPTGSS